MAQFAQKETGKTNGQAPVSVVKGYKAFNPDMTCQGFQFKEGETYEEDGDKGRYTPVCVKSALVDDKTLKADVYYQLIDGKFVEVGNE